MYSERLQGAFPNFMLAEFLRKSRILPQILNSAAFFNNSLVTFTFIFTYSLALQPCDRPTALETPTQLCVLPSAPILSPSSPEDPFQLVSTIAVMTFLFSFPRGYSQNYSYLLLRDPFLLCPTSKFSVCICIRYSIPIYIH